VVGAIQQIFSGISIAEEFETIQSEAGRAMRAYVQVINSNGKCTTRDVENRGATEE
jgi:hypothetical protein